MTDQWINMREYSSVIDTINEGETTRLNHEDCPAGQDTKQRLYLTKSPHGGAVLAYCHNCGNKGVSTDDGHSFRKDAPHHASQHTHQIEIPKGQFTVPNGMTWVPGYWPIEAHKWRIDKGLTINQCVAYGIAFDETSSRIYLPIHETITHNGFLDLLGYQLRLIKGNGPKYTTVLRDRDTIPSTMLGCIDTAKKVVLVEDYCSGIAIHEALVPYTAVLVNYGIKNTIQVLDRANEAAPLTDQLVWLDNDSHEVANRSREIARTWELVTGNPSHCIIGVSDPKYYDDKEIRTIIEERV